MKRTSKVDLEGHRTGEHTKEEVNARAVDCLWIDLETKREWLSMLTWKDENAQRSGYRFIGARCLALSRDAVLETVHTSNWNVK